MTLCQQYHVEKLYLFGSATTDQFTANSDLDRIVRLRLLNVSPEGRTPYSTIDPKV